LTIDESVEKIHRQTGISSEAIRSHIRGWLEMGYEPKGLNDEQMQILESQIDVWIDAYQNNTLK
jgi:hypothetical protein